MDEKEIERLLSEMPTIKDHRSKEAVLERVKKDERLQNFPKRNKSKKWLPAFVAIASILILSIIVPSLLRGNESQIEGALDTPRLKTLEKDDQVGNAEHEIEAYLSDDAEESVIAEAEGIAQFGSNVVLADEVGEMRTFQIGLVTNGAVIPVTLLISVERILADFTKEEPDAVQLYNEYATAIPEEKLGFDNYHPYKGEIMNIDGVIIHQVPDGYSYDETSATKEIYLSSLQATFGNATEHLVVGAQANLAKFSDAIELSDGITPATYYRYSMQSGQDFLVPRYGIEDYQTVEKALLGMKEPQSNGLELLVPEQVKYEVRVEKETAILSFNEVLDLSEMNHDDALAMIEGFMLTAHHYQKTVKLENVLQQSFGEYDFNTTLPEPVAVNPLNFIIE